ncbi:T9SS type B sorting domain-containing protein [Flavobacterium sp.]|uniref:DUF7948 domain-containing protein n=1 Tax=Flavobacterium sp. TaxID=239 RepID=UPI00391DD53A
MNKLFAFLFLTISSFGFAQNQKQSAGFIENKGQIVDQNGKPNEAVKYLLNSKGLNVQLRKNGFSYDIYETKKIDLPLSDQNSWLLKKSTSDYELVYSYHRIDIDFVNSNPKAKFVTEGKSTDYDNYYNVVSKPEGVSNVYKFEKVTYVNIYPNIDVVFFIPEDKSKPVEYNFIINPNGKIEDIKLEFKGARTALVDNKIKMKVRFGTIEETIPMSWIENENDKKEIYIGYRKIKNNIYGFDGDKKNLTGKKIIIDPTPNRLWGTYLGGEGGDSVYDTKIDLNGFLYVGGVTSSFNNIATTISHQSYLWPWNSPNIVNSDCFVNKFDSNGNRIWGTYLGGNVQDNFGGMAIDKLNNLVVSGTTNSNLNSFTTAGTHQPTLNYIYAGNPNNFDAFLLKLNPTGQIIWGTHYGGNLNDTSTAVAVDELNNIVICGITYSMAGIATPGAHKTVFDNQFNSQYEGYIAKFNANGQRIFGTYFGGDMQEQIEDVKIDANNNIYLTGFAYSINGIATPGAFQPIRNTTWDGFITKFSAQGTQIWGTYFGGNNEDYLHRLALGNNAIYVVGKTASDTNIASPGCFLPIGPNVSNAGYDGLMAKFDFDGQRLWSTYFYEKFADLDLDANENIYAIGYTQIDNNIATANPYDGIREIGDAFIQKFNTNGFRLWGTYYGGSSFDEAYSISFDKINTIFYIGGDTSSSNAIASPNAFQPNPIGNYSDGFIAKFQDCLSAPVVDALPDICIGHNINLTANGGTNYSWNGPNGFVSTQQNPIITNANTSHSGQYSCTITGTGGCDGTLSINVIVGDITKPIPDITTLPTITGDCTTIVNVIPTATDNCSGTIIGTTSDPLNYATTGTHIIHWEFNDGQGNIETQNQIIILNSTSAPLVNPIYYTCLGDTKSISDIPITGQNIQWYDAPTGGNLLSSIEILQVGITYYATQTLNSCESSRVPVIINSQNTVAPTGNNPQALCASQNPTLNDIAVNGTAINWYSSNTSTTALPSNTLLVDGTTYYATQTVNGCESVGRLPIAVTLIYSLNAIDSDAFICDNQNNGSEIVDLSLLNYNMASLAGNTFTYYSSFNAADNQISAEQLPTNHTIPLGQTIVYVRIDNINGCHQVVELELTLVSIPIITMPDEFAFCEGSNVTITAPTGFDLYIWSTNVNAPSITLNQAGNYWLMVGNSYGNATCTSTTNFTVVQSNAPTITTIETIDWTDSENSITVHVTGSGDYEYSIDGINYQNSNIFNGLPNGAYLVTVRDKNGCGIDREQVFLLNYPKFFTPNSDGNNDSWSIKFSQFEPNFEVQIFDRYGKLLRVMKNNEDWDGNYNGRQLPSDDYWFTVTRNDGRIHKGHFAMLR